MRRNPIPTRRKICWPTPDEVCLQGGCGYCNNNRFVYLDSIMTYARKAGPKHLEAFWHGLRHSFYNAEVEFYPKGSK